MDFNKKKKMNGQGCTTPTLSNYMLERLRLKCPSKGHHLVMKVIANWFFFFFSQINFFPYHPGNHQPSHYGPFSVSCCNLCFFTIFHSLTMTVWQILRSFYVGHFKCRLYWRRWTRHRHTSQDVSFSSFSIILFSSAKIQNRWTCQEKTVSTVLSHLPLAHLSLLQVTRTGPF